MISSNDPDEGEVSVPVSLLVTGTPFINVSPENLNFGEVFVDVTNTELLIITNVGTEILSVSNLISSHPYFSVGSTSFTLNPDESYSLDVSFSPISAGYQEGVLTIYSNDLDNPEVNVTMTGTSVIAPDITVSPMSLSSELFTNDITTGAMNDFEKVRLTQF